MEAAAVYAEQLVVLDLGIVQQCAPVLDEFVDAREYLKWPSGHNVVTVAIFAGSCAYKSLSREREMKPSQVTRNNHYVPKWYQRGFLQPKQAKLYALDLQAAAADKGVSEASPKRLFCELDLYTTQFGDKLNDEIERLLFGLIDKSGCEAMRALIAGDPVRMHSHFQALYEFLDAQKLRTPKGLDWINRRYGRMSQIDLMVEMQSLRYTHCGIWTEGVREIVSAKNSLIKFLISDHPVTIYHREFPPEAAECIYPFAPVSN